MSPGTNTSHDILSALPVVYGLTHDVTCLQRFNGMRQAAGLGRDLIIRRNIPGD